jgi:hypothetical protein
MLRRVSPVDRALIACLHHAAGLDGTPDLRDALDGIDVHRLVHEAEAQRVGGAVLRTLAGSELSAHPAVEGLQEATARCVVWQMLVVAHMAAVVEALEQLRMPHAVLKGPALAEHVYPDPSWRAYDDLDVLVSSADAPAARAAIENLGARVPVLQRAITDRGFDGEVALFFGDGVNVDLHHEVINDESIRRHFSVPIAEMLSRTRSVQLSGRDVRILDAEDQLLHLCLHAAVSNGRRLVWLLDIDQAVRRDPADPERLVARARRWRAGLPAAVMLERARQVLDTPVDDDLLDALAPRARWRSFCRRMLHFSPPEMANDAVFTGGVVVSSTRHTTFASSVALAQAVWRDGVVAPLRNPRHPWRGHTRRSPENP